jgi:RNA polymerase-binding transcription factor DksA
MRADVTVVQLDATLWRDSDMDADLARSMLLSERVRVEGVLAAAGRLSARAAEAAERELSSAEQHPAELATETIERELDQSVVNHAETELVELDAAMDRLDGGTYGLCEGCGQPINEERLEAMPAARYCVEDQAKVSRNHRRPGR